MKRPPLPNQQKLQGNGGAISPKAGDKRKASRQGRRGVGGKRSRQREHLPYLDLERLIGCLNVLVDPPSSSSPARVGLHSGHPSSLEASAPDPHRPIVELRDPSGTSCEPGRWLLSSVPSGSCSLQTIQLWRFGSETSEQGPRLRVIPRRSEDGTRSTCLTLEEAAVGSILLSYQRVRPTVTGK
jgi:hypothetical protein